MSVKSVFSNGKMSLILPATFINSLSVGISSLGIIFFVKDVFHVNPAITSSIGALWSSSYFVGCIVLPKLTKGLSPVLSMIIMSCISTVLILTIIFIKAPLPTFIVYSLFGFSIALFWPPLMGWLSSGFEGAELGKATNMFSFSWSSAGVFAPYIAGFLYERSKILPLLASAILFFLNAFFIFSKRNVYSSENNNRLIINSSKSAANYQQNAIDRSTFLRYPAWLGVFLIYTAMGVVLNVFPVFARDELLLKESKIGLILMLRALATAIGFYILSISSTLQSKRFMIPIWTLLSALVLGFLTFSGNTATYAYTFALAGLLQASIYNNSLFFGTSGAINKNKRATIHEAVLTFGTVTGSISGGIIYQLLSMPMVFVCLSALTGIGALVQTVLVYKTGPEFHQHQI